MAKFQNAKLDEIIHDKIDAYRADVRTAKHDCEVASAAVSALDARVSVLDAQVSKAVETATTATDNLAAAKAAAHALSLSQRTAYDALSHGVQIEQGVSSTYELLHHLCEQLVKAVDLSKTLESAVEQAVSKNGMPAFVAANAKHTASACRSSAAAALAAMKDAAVAMEQAEQARMAAAALPAGLQRLQDALYGFSDNTLSDLPGVPSKLENVMPDKLLPVLATGNAQDVVSTVATALTGSANTVDARTVLRLSFELRSQNFAIALQQFERAVEATVDSSTPSGSKPQTGMLERFYQLFQIWSQTKQLTLDGKTTAESHLNSAKQELEAKEKSELYAVETLRAAEQARLT